MDKSDIYDLQDSIGSTLNEARAIIDVMVYCQADRLHDNTLPALALMLSKLIGRLDTHLAQLFSTIKQGENNAE